MRKISTKGLNQEGSINLFQNQINFKIFSPLTITFIFLANFFLWSDKLIAYPFSSYIFSRFGDEGFSLYSDFYVIFTIFNIIGFHLAKKFLNIIDIKKDMHIVQIKNLLQTIVYLTLIYIFCLGLLLFSNILILLFTYSFINLLGGLFIVLYTSIFLQISRTGKHENLKYWIMALSSNLASITLLPLGTCLSQFLSMDILIYIVISLTSLSIAFLFSSNYTIKIKKFSQF
ncbi:MAG: hypothetical protein ACFE9C_01235 [Candidatus Hodarchaeota archaeon]